MVDKVKQIKINVCVSWKYISNNIYEDVRQT